MNDQEDLLCQVSCQLTDTPHSSPIRQSPASGSPWPHYSAAPADKHAASARDPHIYNSINTSAWIPLTSCPAAPADSVSQPQTGESVGHEASLAQADLTWPPRQSLSDSLCIDFPRPRVQGHSLDEQGSQTDRSQLDTLQDDVFRYDRVFSNSGLVYDYLPQLPADSLVAPGRQCRTSVPSVPDVSTHIPHVSTHIPHVSTHIPHVSTHIPHVRTHNPYLRSEHGYQNSHTFTSGSHEDLWTCRPVYEKTSLGYHTDVSHLFTSSTPSALGSGDTQPGSTLSVKSSQGGVDNSDVYGKISLDLGTTISGSNRWNLDSNNSTSRVNRCNSETDLQHTSFFDSGILSPLNNFHSRNTQVQTQSFHAPRPSYSDIAKTPKSTTKFEPRIGPPNVKMSSGSFSMKSVKKDRKMQRPAVKRTLSGPNVVPCSCQGEDVAVSQVAPFSRYGLDNFDEHMDFVKSHQRGSADYMTGSPSGVNPSVSVHDIPAPETRHVTTHEAGSQHRQTSQNGTTATTTLSVTSGDGCTLRASGGPGWRRKASKVHPQDSASDDYHGISQTNTHDPGTVSVSSSDTVLNNGKPALCKVTCKSLSGTHQSDYINNNLRDSSKLTNQTVAKAGLWLASCQAEDHYKQKESKSSKRYATQNSGSCHERSKGRDSSSKNHVGLHGSPGTWHNQKLLPALDTHRLDAWCAAVVEKLVNYWNLSMASMFSVATYTLGILLHLASSATHMLSLLVVSVFTLIKDGLYRSYLGSDARTPQRGHTRTRVGLDDNISLPTTGEEAIKRLLSCKGKDPYSILGLRPDASDDDIKKFYRKQAILVHPDKNQEPGAEDAFKILGHAFKMIADPVKRKQYDGHTQEAQELQAMRKFAEMLSKLQTKIQEAANMMYCDVCGGKHRRVPVDRPFYSARFCQQCNARHSAKGGDIWAESTMLGFYWHYFALLDGHVFDITDWMKCHRRYFQHMKANAHTVTYKLASDASSRHPHTGGAKLQDFMNCLFKASSVTAQGHSPSWSSPRADKWTPATGVIGASSSTTRNSHHKKRHL